MLFSNIKVAVIKFSLKDADNLAQSAGVVEYTDGIVVKCKTHPQRVSWLTMI